MLTNAAMLLALAFPGLRRALHSGWGRWLVDGWVRQRAAPADEAARAYLRRVEGASGLFWRFDAMLPELDLGAEEAAAFRAVVAASRAGRPGRIRLAHYHRFISELQVRGRRWERNHSE